MAQDADTCFLDDDATESGINPFDDPNGVQGEVIELNPQPGQRPAGDQGE